MRRLLMVCAVAAVLVATFPLALPRRTAVAAGASNASFSVPDPQGCPIEPAFTFCNQIPGTASSPEPFTITVLNPATVVSTTLAAIPGLTANFAPGDFTIDSNTCVGMLMANQSCTVGLAFTPTTVGLRMAQLTVTFSGGGTVVINVAGTGATFVLAAPTPPACPQDIAFTYCNEPIGGVSAAQQFTLTSTNAVTGLNIFFAAVPGLEGEFSSSDFTIETTTCGGSLLANTSCTINVSFTPTIAGLREAALTATDFQGDSAVITVGGHTNTGLAIAFQSSMLGDCTPMRGFFFCNEPQGGTSASKTFTLTNTSGTQLAGISIPAATSPPDFTVQGSSCASTLAANASCEFSVAFTPQNTGLRQAALAITDSAGDLGVANFAGTGDDFEIIAPNNVTQLSVDAGTPATYMLEITTPGNVFSGTVTLVCPANLPAETTCTFNSGNAMNITSIDVVPNTPVQFSAVFQTTSRVPQPPPKTWLPFFPGDRPGLSPFIVALALLALFTALATRQGAPGSRARLRRLIFASALFMCSAGLLGACGSKKAVGTTGTPVGKTVMNLQGTALGAGRGITLTLFVD